MILGNLTNLRSLFLNYRKQMRGYKNISVTYSESDEENGVVINQTPSYVVSPHAEQDISIELVVSKTPEPTAAPQPVSESETQPEISTEPESETLEYEDGQDF